MRQLPGAITVSLLLCVGIHCTPATNPPETGDPIPSSDLPYVTLVTPQGTIVIEVFTDSGTAAGLFRDYATDGYYTDSVVHDVRQGQWIRFGQYDAALAKLPDRVVANESDNGLTHTRGRVAVNGPFSADSGSPFVHIDLGDNSGLDFAGSPVDLTVIGRVVKGLEVADAIAALNTTVQTAGDGTRLTSIPQPTVRILEAGVGFGPLAEAGADQTVDVNVQVTLDASGSAPRTAGQPLSYAWTQVAGPAVTLADATTAKATFTPTGVATLVFEVVVTEAGRAETSKDQVTITVQASDNRPPVADAGADQNVDSGATVTLDGSASQDPDLTDTITYAWAQISGAAVVLSDPAAAEPTFTAPAQDAVLIFELTVTDDEGGAATDRVQVTVRTAPTADAGPDQTLFAVQQVVLDGAGSRPAVDGSTLTYAWSQSSGPAVTLSDAAVVNPAFTPPQVGTYSFVLLVTEASTGLTGSDDVTIVVNSPVNSAPVANAGPDQTVAAGATVTLDGTGSSDPDPGDTLAYTWTQTEGDPVSLSDATAAQPAFTAPDAAGILAFQLEVSDGVGGEASSQLSIRVLKPVAGEDHLVVPGVIVTLDGSESAGPAGTTLEFDWSQISGPEVTLSAPTAAQTVFTVPAGEADGTLLTFRLTIRDSTGATATDDIDLTLETDPVVRLETTMGNIDMEMFIDGAPRTVLNFCQYVEDRYYDGIIFHRVVSDFVVQGGGLLPDLSEKPGQRDPVANEFSPDRSNVEWTVAMARRSGLPDSADAQFFINLKDNSGPPANLDAVDGGFTVFGRVVDPASQAVVDAIAAVPVSSQQSPTGTGFSNVPVDDIIITRARVR